MRPNENKPRRRREHRENIFLSALSASLRLILLFSLSQPLPSEIVDRIALTVGDQVITESEILLQIRLNAFINGDKLDYSPSAKRRAADRMIDQALLAKEMEVSRFPDPPMTDVIQDLADLKKDRFQTDEQYRNELAARGIKEDELKLYLQRQMRALRFVDFRFRAGVQVSEAEIQTYYKNEFVPAWKKTHQEQPPPLEDVTDDIEEVLASRQVDTNTEQWLKQARGLTRIQMRQEVFQ
jgi:peptidyl-prolyl cis-trans isomerase SurA